MNSHTEKFIHAATKKMSRADKRILEEMYEHGCSDEDVFAALPSDGAAELLKRKSTESAVEGAKNVD